MSRFLLESGETHEHSHSYNSELMVEKGTVAINFVNKLGHQILNSNDSLAIVANTSHNITNVGNDECIINCIRVE